MRVTTTAKACLSRLDASAVSPFREREFVNYPHTCTTLIHAFTVEKTAVADASQRIRDINRSGRTNSALLLGIFSIAVHAATFAHHVCTWTHTPPRSCRSTKRRKASSSSSSGGYCTACRTAV